jgi:MFS family permease
VSMKKKDRLYYGWIVVTVCLFIGVFSFGIRYSYGIFFKSLQQDFGWSRTLTSWVFSSYMLFCSLFAILGGWVQDRYGPRIIIILTGLFTGMSLLLTSHAHSLWHLFIGYSLLLAMGTGPTYTVTMAIALKWFVRRRVLAVAIVGSGGGFGLIAMAPIAAYLITHYGWQYAYFIVGLVALFSIPPSALLLRKAPDAVAPLPEEERLAVPNPSSIQEQTPNEPKDFSLPQAIKTMNFWLLLFVWFLYSFCFHMVLTHLVPYATDLGISSMKAATVVTSLGIAIICGRLITGRMSGTIGLKQTAIASAIFMMGAMLLLAGGKNLWLLYIFAAVFGLSYGGLDPPVTVLIGNVFGLCHIGVIIGVLAGGFAAGAAVGPALAGYIFDVSGKYFFAFLISAVSMLIAALSIFLVREPGYRVRPP